ncbi:hypothetical protein BDV25DRAFT_140696 [Aspergillus avenaceus]|uniref:Polyketide synthase n=1 Tax=Aspergillus avenaceus TaxID=36643 RepID=A0A5N6TT99_ASPAV|nr:hypothetical protein BDV25DRAFT_140696 [Aspergillus avenaceus]
MNRVIGADACQDNRDETKRPAIVGMSCRLPGMVDSPARLWELCSRARSAWSKVPESKFSAAKHYHPTPGRAGSFYYEGGHFLDEDVGLFDAPFFNLTMREAQSMDPQQRILLECTYEALENAGITKQDLSNQKVGVFIGGSFPEYHLRNVKDPEEIPMFESTGNAMSMQANRISYYFNLKGPSIAIDTACSSSLSALHLACQSLETGESEIAIVGACHINLIPEQSISMSLSRLFSVSGRCYTFDHRASGGFGRGEGCGCIIIRPLDSAVAANDLVRAVIVGTGVNQDGRTNGITQPNGTAQEQLIKSVYERSGIDPSQAGYVEAHGTGTKVGDPIEARALQAVFGEGRTPRRPLYVGSVKSNIGHTETASGVISIIKTVMMLEKELILPNCNFEKPNPEIPMHEWNMKVPTKLTPWPRNKPYASVNNFGFGGTNAHIILTKAPSGHKPLPSSIQELISADGDDSIRNPPRRVYPISAYDKDSVQRQLKSLETYLERHPEVFDMYLMENLAYTLGERRTTFPWRAAVSATSAADLISQISSSGFEPFRAPEEPVLGFVFTGQGAQWHGMGKELLHRYPLFANTMKQADDCIKRLGAQFSIVGEITREQESPLLTEPSYSQASCTAIQLALVRLIKSWGIIPSAVIGHSSGEIAAAYAAEMLEFDDCMRIAYYRGVVAQDLRSSSANRKGGMMAVGANQEEAEALIQQVQAGKAVIACTNSASSLTLSGDEEAINELQALAEEKGLFNRRLRVDVAYHSHHMELVSASYRSLIGDIRASDSRIQFFSSAFGRQAKAEEINSEYWLFNLVSSVNFAGGLQTMLQQARPSGDKPIDTLLEVGPHSALEAPSRETIQQVFSKKGIQYMTCLRRKSDGVETVQKLVAQLFMRGLGMDFGRINSLGYEKLPDVLNNLPKYPWNHSVRYWHESQFSRNITQTISARNDILGSLSVDTDFLEPRWRNVVRADDYPWIKQHQVGGKYVYPFAGYIAMAMEAFSQNMTLRKCPISGFHIREVSVTKALVVPDTSAVEMITTLRPFAEGTRYSSEEWYEFRVSATSDGNGWTEHCRGLISGEKEKQKNPVNGDQHLHRKQSDAECRTAMIASGSLSRVNRGEMYDTLSASGVDYGEIFRGLDSIHSSTHHAMADFCVPDISAVMPDGYESEYILHPVTLDLCFQLVWPLLDYRAPGQKQIYLPTFIGDIYTTCDFSFKTGDTLKLHGSRTGTLHPRLPAEINIVATSAEGSGDAIIKIENMKMTPIIERCGQQDLIVKGLCYKTETTPCFEFLNNSMVRLIGQPSPPEPTELHKLRVLEQASFYFLERAREKLAYTERASIKGHYHHFLDWAKRTGHQARHGGLPLQNAQWLKCSDEEQHVVIQAAQSMGAPGRMLCNLGSQIPQILQRQVEPLSIMLEDRLWDKYYQELDSFRRSYAAAVRIIDKLADQSPQMNILEIGAGTGGATLPIVQELGGGDTQRLPRFGHYTFTDISSGFLEDAKEKFRSWGDLFDYQTLDIYQDPIGQGYEEHAYDLIIACNVLHATPKMDRTLTQVHKLLKPGGKLLLIEETGQQLRQFVYALLPGWWLSEDGRIDGPGLDKGSWDELLRATGFSGLDLVLDDYPDAPEQCGSLMVSTSKIRPQNEGQEVVIIPPAPSNTFPIEELTEGIKALTGRAPELSTLSAVDFKGKICIYLGELDAPVLSRLDEPDFAMVQNLFQDTTGLLWVIRPDYDGDIQSAESQLVCGLARSVRSETDRPIVSLELEPTWASSSSRAVEHILNVFSSIFSNSVSEQPDWEYQVKDGVLHVPRVVNDAQLNEFVSRATGRCDPELQPLKQERPFKLTVSEPGVLDTLCFTGSDSYPELPEGHIEVQVEFVGLNFKDVMTAMGQMDKDTLGNECSGIVTRVSGENCGFAQGDRVCAIYEGAFATSITCPATSAWKIPHNMDLKVAATIPVIFCTAYYALFDVGRLIEGESVLIHAAAGGVGQAAIILANMIGAEVFATVSTQEKKKLLIDTYGVHEENIFFSRDSSFAEDVLRATDGNGVDVVLNSLAGSMLQASWNCVASFGRFVELGKKDILRNTRLEMARFNHNAIFASVDLIGITEKKPMLMRRLLSDVFQLFSNGTAQPVVPITSFSVSETEAAFRSLQGGRGMGKSVIELQPEALVKVYPPDGRQVHLSPDACYVIVGGSGGLGRNIAEWLSKNGARHIVLLSRSGDTRESVMGLIKRAESDGVRIVAPPCDISDSTQVEAAVTGVLQSMPPIRGVIFGALDCLFEQMQYCDYQAVIAPRVHGLLNIHHTLKETNQTLDFFINLSSVAGTIGNRGQAAYAASSTFMGAFARSQIAAGYPFTNIDLGPVKGIGYLAEHKGAENEIFNTLESQGVEEDEIHALLAGAITGAMANTCNGNCITSLGIATDPNNGEDPFWHKDPRFSHLVRQKIASRAASQRDTEDSATPVASIPLATAVRKSGTWDAAVPLIVEGLAQRLSSLLLLPLEDISPSESVASYGLDSLVAIEVRNWVRRELEAYLQILDIISAESLVVLAERILAKSKLSQYLSVAKSEGQEVSEPKP